MSRPCTLFGGQWADLPLEELARKASEFGYDGIELPCWGDFFDVEKALSEPDYCAKKRELLERHGLEVFAISNHLVGQAVLDNIDARHQGLVPADVWGNGDPAGVNARAAENMKKAASRSKASLQKATTRSQKIRRAR